MSATCATRAVVEYIDNDDSLGHIECACGFVGRGVKVCWLREQAAKHLGIDVETFKAREDIDHPTVRWRGPPSSWERILAAREQAEGSRI